jgi:hypothetical protein
MGDFRTLKKQIRDYLLDRDMKTGLYNISRIEGRKAVNPLFSYFYDGNELLRWRSVTAMGIVLSKLVSSNKESARVVMRRMIWNLNDESGGIGWGSPEAMGEAMARCALIADEYHHILLSYIMPEGNYIEHETLQQGVLWGIARLAHKRPHLVEPSAALLLPYLASSDPPRVGLAAWTAGLYDCPETNGKIDELKQNKVKIRVYTGQAMEDAAIGDLASSRVGYDEFPFS